MGGLMYELAPAAAGVLLAITIALAARLIMYRREIARLSCQLREFCDDAQHAPAFSVRDNAFAQLENGVAELESQLQLCQQQRATESDYSAGLILDISHQLKTPLASLKLMCELDAAPHAERMVQLIDRMEHMVRELLRLEKLRAGGYEFDLRTHDLSDIAAEAVRPLHEIYPNRTISVCGHAQLRCDEYWLGEALTNLIKNACEHTEPGGRIQISIEPSEGGASCVVHDDGGGVSQSELGQLFRRFYHSATSTGSGVGLALVREVVQRHHGGVYADNALLPGATRPGLRVVMWLPALAKDLQIK